MNSPPLATLNNRPNNLAYEPSSFIGREPEINELTSLALEGKWLLAEILKSAPKVSILVTSREPLRVQAGRCIRLNHNKLQ